MAVVTGPNRSAEQANQDSCVGVSIAFTVVSIIIVGLRTYVRVFMVRNFGIDDAFMLGALLWTVAYLITIFILKVNGMGFSGSTLSLNQMTNLVKTTLSLQIFYYLIVYCIKISILFFYLRIAVNKQFEKYCKWTLYLLTVFVVICIIVCVTQCIPLHKMWDFTGLVKGTCINGTAFFYSTSSFNIITDVWILFLPIPTLLSIQRPSREKLALIGVFSLGIFSCIASIVRLHSIRIYTESKDPFYDSVPINLWSMVEVNIGIWCASIPALKALFVKAQREKSRGTGYQYHSRDKSGSGMGGKGGSAESRGTVHELGNMGGDGGVQAQRTGGNMGASVSVGVGGERSGSEERIYIPGREGRV
ncbi:hypothetical protein B0J11DRAFT_592292 [Dendryphion nanum]|uniref:Rhodopsin domain-containing protein n=1 Tax=Dendryphion nanum TaxID=256645 RepID=A0A9P9DF39_9PLEO|nr:hypothetical protein B0J11DRAFT_592292 [Dendryphion nanum]